MQELEGEEGGGTGWRRFNILQTAGKQTHCHYCVLSTQDIFLLGQSALLAKEHRVPWSQVTANMTSGGKGLGTCHLLHPRTAQSIHLFLPLLRTNNNFRPKWPKLLKVLWHHLWQEQNRFVCRLNWDWVQAACNASTSNGISSGICSSGKYYQLYAAKQTCGHKAPWMKSDLASLGQFWKTKRSVRMDIFLYIPYLQNRNKFFFFAPPFTGKAVNSYEAEVLLMIMESENHLGWKGSWRSSCLNPPAMVRGTFH